MKITAVRSVCRIRTTLIFERHVCPIGLIPDAVNYQIFPPKKETVTTQFSPKVSIPYKEKKHTQLILLVESLIFFKENSLS